MPDKHFAYESLQDRESIVAYLAALGEGLRNGKLKLASNGRSFALEAPPLMEFNLHAKQKRGRVQIVLKMTWKNRAEEDGADPLLIRSDEHRD